MCRGKDQGNRRCPHDTSEARKRRRRAAQGQALYQENIPIDPESRKVSIDTLNPKSIKELKKEAQFIGALLHAPVNKDPEIQAKIDAQNELLVTRLGIQLAHEAEKRANFSLAGFEKEYETSSPEFQKISEEIRPLRKLHVDALFACYKAEGKFASNDPAFVVDEEEVARLRTIYAEADAEFKKVNPLYQEQVELDKNRKEALVATETNKLAQAYRSVIADIRPLGGKLTEHALSSNDAKKTFTETVGKDYPSDWIQASNKGEPMIMITADGRPSYSPVHTVEGEDAKGLKPHFEYVDMVGKAKDIRETARLLSEDGDKAEIAGSPFELQDNNAGVLLSLRFPHRIPLDPKTDPVDTKGNPVGEGWKYGHVINDKFEVDGTKQWYRSSFTGNGQIAALVISDSSNPKARPHAYHEAIHRFEAIIPNGAMTRAETAFLNRRTANNGNPPKLKFMAPASNLIEAELISEGGFASQYIGKVYINQQSKEVLSVGSESLFGGTYGGLLGLDQKHSPDRDHRGFVLGMFASA
jgi:hypothetical protein